MALRIDANAGYDAESAIRLLRLVEQFDLQLFEQPVPADDLAGMARVRREAGGVRIMADESILDHASLVAVIRAQAADIVKLKVMKQGGFHRTSAMLATAEAAGMRCVIGHGFGLGVNTMAEIMLAATSASVLDGLECVGPLKTADDIVTEKIDLGSGVLALPPGAGTGCRARRGQACALPLRVTRSCTASFAPPRSSPPCRRSPSRTLRGRSACWCRSRPAAPSTSWRASSARGSPKSSGSRSWSRTAVARPERSPRRW
jgi:L-alanine-DL-glutamate epimerase-like enolase superfamily enzyme